MELVFHKTVAKCDKIAGFWHGCQQFKELLLTVVTSFEKCGTVGTRYEEVT